MNKIKPRPLTSNAYGNQQILLTRYCEYYYNIIMSVTDNDMKGLIISVA